MTNCYCGSQKAYEDCCSPFLSGKLKPETPEQLMRSRYSAFYTKNIEYLMNTLHPSKHQVTERDALAKTISTTKWLGLKVIKSQVDQDVGYVEFAAFFKNNTTGHLHENSKFKYENGQWYYFDGVILEPLKFARNTPCWCGSDKKYKKCHGK